MKDLELCRLCGRSAWVHHLRGLYLFCDELGGIKSNYTAAQVNHLRSVIGKKRLLPSHARMEHDAR